MQTQSWLLLLVVALGCQRQDVKSYATLPANDVDISAVTEESATKSEPKLVTVQRPPFSLPFLGGDDQPHERSLQDTVADSLARIGVDAVPGLIAALGDADVEVRLHSARALALMGPKGASAVPALIQTLNDEDESVRRAAARALGQMGPAAKEAVPWLIHMLKNPNGDKPQRLPPSPAH